MSVFRDRVDGGRFLSTRLLHYRHHPDVLVLGLPRGGVPVAWQVASVLHAPLDVFVVRKLGAPGEPELAMGAVASGGITVFNPDVLDLVRIPAPDLEDVARREATEVARREHLYRGDNPAPSVDGRTVIVVDDGLATGATMRAAVQALRKQHPQRLVVGVPVGAREACDTLERLADELVCGYMPSPFYGVGAWYRDFSQTSDDEVRDLLRRAAARFPPAPPPPPPQERHKHR